MATETMNQLLLMMAKASGCTCQPEIRTPKPKRGMVVEASVAHDDWCALLSGEGEKTRAGQGHIRPVPSPDMTKKNRDANRGNPPEPEPTWDRVPTGEVPVHVGEVVSRLLTEEAAVGCRCDPEVELSLMQSTAWIKHEGTCPLSGPVRVLNITTPRTTAPLPDAGRQAHRPV